MVGAVEPYPPTLFKMNTNISHIPLRTRNQAAVEELHTASPAPPATSQSHGTRSREVYRIIAKHLVRHRQHKTCANLNATCKAIFSATLPILFRVVIWRFDWTEASTLQEWLQTQFLPLTRARGAKYIEFLIDESPIERSTVPTDPANVLLFQTRAKVIEPILRHSLPSMRNGRLKATATILGRQTYIWTHENFQYNPDDFATLFESFFGAAFAERDFKFRQVTMFRHDLGRVWLTTQPSATGGPVFRLRWEGFHNPAPVGIPGQAITFGEVRHIGSRSMEAIQNVESAFMDAVSCLASFSASHMYRSVAAEEVVSLPELIVDNLDRPALARILQTLEDALMQDTSAAYVNILLSLVTPIAMDQIRELLFAITPAYLSVANRDMHMPSAERLIIKSPFAPFPSCKLIGTIELNFARAQRELYLCQQGPGSQVFWHDMISWPFIAASQTALCRTGKQSNQPVRNLVPLDIPTDICTCVARCLVDANMQGTCASLSAISSQVRYATLPTLYRVLVWTSRSWDAVGNGAGDWNGQEDMQQRAMRMERLILDVYTEELRLWNDMINGAGAQYIKFIVDCIRDFPYFRRLVDREYPPIRQSFLVGALPRLKASVTTAETGFRAFIHDRFGFGSNDVISLLECLDRLPRPPNAAFEGYSLQVDFCRNGLWTPIVSRGGRAYVPTTRALLQIWSLHLDFAQVSTVWQRSEERPTLNHLSRFYAAAVRDALKPRYLQRYSFAPSKYTKVARSSKSVYVTAPCSVADIRDVLSLVTPTYLGHAPWLCLCISEAARLFRITSWVEAASGSLTIGVSPGRLDLQIREGASIVERNQYEFDIAPPPPDDVDTLIDTYAGAPFRQ